MPPLYLFIYDFPHRKSEDLVLECVRQGVKIDGLIAAPKKILEKRAEWRGFDGLPQLSPTSPSQLAARLGVPYYVCPHEDAKAIATIVEDGAVGIIGGARIIPNETIGLFDGGIINYHPGRIPDTSGLDSFYWMLVNGVPPVVTAHFIDRRVDAGHLIAAKEVVLNESDTPATVHYKLYVTQLEMNREIMSKLKSGCIETSPLNRPRKNDAMDDEGRKRALIRFESWLKNQLERQVGAARAIPAQTSE